MRKGSCGSGSRLLLLAILLHIIFLLSCCIGWKKLFRPSRNFILDAPTNNNYYLVGRRRRPQTVYNDEDNDATTLAYNSELDSNEKLSNQYAADIDNIQSPPLDGSSDIVSTTQDDECSIYLAPSGVTDENNKPAGFGIYTTKPIKSGEAIFPRGTGP